MNEEIKEMLAEEIKEEIRDLSTLEPGSEAKSTAIENLTKLYKLKIEETKVEWDFIEKRDESATRGLDQNLRRDQFEEQVKDRYFRFGIEAAGILLPLMFYAAWMQRGFKFEETGTFTSTTFRGLFNRFRPTK